MSLDGMNALGHSKECIMKNYVLMAGTIVAALAVPFAVNAQNEPRTGPVGAAVGVVDGVVGGVTGAVVGRSSDERSTTAPAASGSTATTTRSGPDSQVRAGAGERSGSRAATTTRSDSNSKIRSGPPVGSGSRDVTTVSYTHLRAHE